MLQSDNETGLFGVLNELARSNIKFYPTGSRYFGQETKDSDWDFFVERTAAVYQFLENLGFIQEKAEKYEKPLQEVVDVFRYPKSAYDRQFWNDFDTERRKRGSLVDVQISTNVAKRLKIQATLKSVILGRVPTNEEWEIAYKLLA